MQEIFSYFSIYSAAATNLRSSMLSTSVTQSAKASISTFCLASKYSFTRSVISSLISLSDLPFIASAIFCSSLFVADNEKLRSGAIKENVPNPINITASVKIKINFLYRSGIYPHPSSNIKTHLEGLEPPAHGSGNRCSIH